MEMAGKKERGGGRGGAGGGGRPPMIAVETSAFSHSRAQLLADRLLLQSRGRGGVWGGWGRHLLRSCRSAVWLSGIHRGPRYRNVHTPA